MFQGSDWLVWVGVALILAVVEAATVDFIFLMLAGGALAGAVAAAFGSGFPVQAVVAAVSAVALLVGVRPWVKRRFNIRTERPTVGIAGNVGRTAIVLETVTLAGGRINLLGETWSARSQGGDALLPGDKVEVVAIDGATAVVVPVTLPPQPLP
mgnify:CR=1 FL=1